MALLTIPSAPEKGVPQTYTLNVTDLIALISDSYFQQQTNWSKVVVMYQSSVSNQIEGITFTPDGVSTSLEADGTFSLEARDIFNVQSITVVDKQNGRNITYAASIPDVANYTIDFDTTSFFSDPLGSDTYNIVDNNITKTSGIESYGSNIVSTAKIPSSGFVQFTNNNVVGVFFLAGLSKNPRQSSAASIDYAINNGTFGYEIYESGVMKLQTGSPASGDVIKVSINGGVVTYYINGNIVYTSLTPSSGEHYLEVSLYTVGSSLSNCSVTPATGILAGAYALGSNPMQNITSPSPGEGQSFVLASPASVTSVKVMISKNAGGPPLTGTLNMTLKASDYLGVGAEVVSSNTLDLSTLAQSLPGFDGGVVCEFLFDTPVSLPSGTNSIKYNYAGLNVIGTQPGPYIQVWGYSPTITDGIAYSYGGPIAHVDFWFQIIGN